MKVSVVQPFYSLNKEDTEDCFQGFLSLFSKCDESSDIIVLPEYCDIPAAQDSCDAFHASIKERNHIVREEVRKLAIRTGALVFANYAEDTGNGFANVTHAISPEGAELYKYFKAHPAPSEVKTKSMGGNEMDCSYSFSYRKPDIFEYNGIRFGFMTCYDFYMTEMFPALARMKPDIIIGCSHQRTDTHNALDIFGRYLCYETNAWLVRAGISLGDSSEVSGCSMVVSPRGEMVLNMKNEVGVGSVEIDPEDKYYKAAGFRGKKKSHFEYTDEGRRPWLYRPAGSMMIPDDDHLPYPRVCAHRGFNTVNPENSMPAFGSAVAMGASEIEFDLWWTKDHEIVSIHDSSLDRVSTGTGKIWEYTYEELKAFDFGVKKSESFRGLSILKFEDILKKFACTTIMNIHIKDNGKPYDETLLQKIIDLIDQYDCRRHVYFMTGSDELLEKLQRMAPDITRCCGAGTTVEGRYAIVDRAIRYGCKKVQLFLEYYTPEMIEKAHANGIICNYFYKDDIEGAREMMEMGIDTLLTNDYLTISKALNIK